METGVYPDSRAAVPAPGGSTGVPRQPVVSAAFVTPYPPGFPILVPGQLVTADILDYLSAVDVKEIHGFDPERGLRVFRQDVLERLLAANPAARPLELEKAAR
jgi:arginine decarboxylase